MLSAWQILLWKEYLTSFNLWESSIKVQKKVEDFASYSCPSSFLRLRLFAIPGSIWKGIPCLATSGLVSGEPESKQNRFRNLANLHTLGKIWASDFLLLQALFPMASSASQVQLWLPSEQNLSPIITRCILQNHS